ncbi:MAG: hypothetical protein HZA46_17935 [Planctomycetales bacterium]|nr:hypothetical protein [Planctomycetales bacterium]
MKATLFTMLGWFGLMLGTTASAEAQVDADDLGLFVSGTMHIESTRTNWPDPDALMAFFERATVAGLTEGREHGMRWSIGADIGWLRNEPRAAEVIAVTQAMGVEWDIHAHQMADRPECYSKIMWLGGVANTVASGLNTSEIDALRRTLRARDGTTWRARVLWGITLRTGHGVGADDQAYGVWQPASSAAWQDHDPRGSLIAVGGGDRTLGGAELFALALGAFGSDAPVTSATINVSPSTLTVVGSADGIDVIEEWAARMGAIPFVQWGTISETAAAWVAAGGISSRLE